MGLMGSLNLPAEVAPGPTKPAIRAIVLQRLAVAETDHVVDIGAGSGAVSIAAGQTARRVTAIERDADRVDAIEENLDANTVSATVEVVHGEAPAALPDTADAAFIGGSQRVTEVIAALDDVGVDRIVMTAARLQTAARAIDCLDARGLLEEVLLVQVARGYDLANETALDGATPVYVLVGGEAA